MGLRKKKTEIKISVRNLIEFILRSGDLESHFAGRSRGVEGTKAHQKVQKSRAKENYQAEFSLSQSLEQDDYILTISGRVDGILHEGDKVIIEEIKSTNSDLNIIDDSFNRLHWAQAKVYAYFYSCEQGLAEISVQLTYFQLETEEVKEIQINYSLSELKKFFNDLIEKYLYWSDFSHNWYRERNESINRLEFPFSSYRKGQRELAVSVYKTILDEKKLYVQAPTGIGKTISTIFPSIKALAEKLGDKIFYLTAKTVTRQVVEENIQLLYKGNLKFKALTLTAKEKICFQNKSDCNPDICPYASGHYDRVNEALKDILNNEDMISREKVEEYAGKYRVCPFEFSLDLALWVDMLICDYNYVFDPQVGLKRFFTDDGGNYIFLIDEAHNLVDRAREMYSAELYLIDFLDLKEILENKGDIINKGVKAKVYFKFIAYLNKIIELLSSYESKLVSDDREEGLFALEDKRGFKYNGTFVQKEEPLEYYPLLNGFISRAEELLLINQKGTSDLSEDNDKGRNNTYTVDDIMELILEKYFNVLSFLRIAELYGENFIVYYQKASRELSRQSSGELDNDSFIIKLFCLDPREQLQEILKKGKTAVFFSATLTPLRYHREILAGSEEDYLLDLESPFDSDNLSLLVAPGISTRYRERRKGFEEIADYIAVTAEIKRGNYMVFFPSYAYMRSVVEIFQDKYQEFIIRIQARDMTEKERLDYLEGFNNQGAVIGFAVLGGVFSEGVDLKGDRLIGSIIVGVAHPQICLERELIRYHFQKTKNTGYEFAYLYPGINKVLQAAGRTIRSETDKGLILLIGERFNTYRYSRMLPAWWNQVKKIVYNSDGVKKELKSFWI